MKGSIARMSDDEVSDWTFKDHINGNALYRLDSPHFIKYVSLVSKLFWSNPSRYVDSYDVALHLARQDRQVVSWQEYTDTMHLFSYTNVVVNMYRQKLNGSEFCQREPETYLVHGRNVYH